MTTVSQDVTDPSRPFYQRQKGRIGVYIDVYEAVANEQTHGSEHYFVMLMMETLYKEYTEMDLTIVKGGIEKHNICDGLVLEGFKEGIILIAVPDDIDALEGMWKTFENGQLGRAIQETLITEDILKVMRTSSIQIRAKLWKDEYEACKEELLSQKLACLRIEKADVDFAMLKRAKECQKDISKEILSLRDQEDHFEQTLGEFIEIVKRYQSEYKNATASLKQFEAFVKNLRSKNKKVNLKVLDHYLSVARKLRSVYEKVQHELWFPMSQIRRSCENEKQRRIKKDIITICREVVQSLKLNSDLCNVRYLPWEGKVLPREKDLILGAVSLIPMSIARLSDIDHMLDEYLVAGDIRIPNKS